MRED
jgi:hypothetical protein